ncbi:hypothetical protein [Longimicrobium sp.]|uniref:hypothetical protein n=1 Tax=Longimicrobium sp. TaxID=2029185 RepID=UPI002CC75A8C|nr:hypothetical protein [Longimicrobium sp.]HSU14569.1 hypothetical protein [Longimicrobium sp.]
MRTALRRPPPDGPPVLAPVERIIARVRRVWRWSVLVRALVVAPALLAASAILLIALDLLVPLRAVLREVLRWVPPALAVGTLAYAAWRIARPPSPRRFALLAEERLPDLDNRLVTAFDVAVGDPESLVARAFVADAERRLAGVEANDVAPFRILLPISVLVTSWAIALGFAAAFPVAAREAWGRWLHPRDAYEQRWREVRANTLPAVPEPPMPAFDEMRWRVAPPAYAGQGDADGRGDEPLQALAGSRVRLRSAFFDRWDAVRAVRIGGGQLPVHRSGGEWAVEWTQSANERGISLEALAHGEVVARRVVPVTVVPDRAPDVQLTAPEQDLVLASGHGRIPVRATAADDYGVGPFALAWSRTRGSGETFQYVEGVWQFGSLRRGGKTAAGELVLDLDAMKLEPGDVIHVRAVATDRNDVTGPGESVSRTRMIRIARPEEMDRVNTDVGFPLEMPKDPLLSQRMLLIRTERLRAQHGRIPEPEYRAKAAEIASDQERLRERVGEQIFTRQTSALQDLGVERGFTEEGGAGHHDADQPAAAPPTGQGANGESFSDQVLAAASAATGQGTIDEVSHKHDADPILDVNRTLLSLYNIMWAAERELNQGSPDAALPHEREALRVIDQLRKAERIFPSGNVRADPVDVDSARGQGKLDDAAPSARAAGAPLPNADALLAEMDRVAGAAAGTSPRALSMRLSGLAARALAGPGADPQAAALLSRAAGEAQSGRTAQARALLLRARARIAPGAATRARALPSTADPAAADYFRRLGRAP